MTSAQVSIRPMGGVLGGEILGVGALSSHNAGCLLRALAAHGVLICRDNRISLEDMQRLTGLISREARFHGVASGGLPPARFAWSMDPSWQPQRPAALVVSAEQVPPQGGESIWSSLEAAYRNLSVPMRGYLARLNAGHGRSEGHVEVWRPLVAPHPLTGTACLDFSPDLTHRISGVPEDEGQLILELLRNHVYAPENQIRIPWCEGMVVLWDCRIAHHYPVGGFAASGWRLTGFSACHRAAYDLVEGQDRIS